MIVDLSESSALPATAFASSFPPTGSDFPSCLWRVGITSDSVPPPPHSDWAYSSPDTDWVRLLLFTLSALLTSYSVSLAHKPKLPFFDAALCLRAEGWNGPTIIRQGRPARPIERELESRTGFSLIECVYTQDFHFQLSKQLQDWRFSSPEPNTPGHTKDGGGPVRSPRGRGNKIP